MTTSTQNESHSDDQNIHIEHQKGGIVADILTLARALLTPIIMIVIIKAWPMTEGALIASMLFIIAALTDFFDDYFGGTEIAPARNFGWFDDIADIILVIGTLIALAWAMNEKDLLNWMVAIPVTIIIGKELIIGLVKGFELSNLNPIEDKLATAKNALSMLAVSVLVASPWITIWVDRLRADTDPYAVYYAPSPVIWLIGVGLLWLAALVSLMHGARLFQATSHINNGVK